MTPKPVVTLSSLLPEPLHRGKLFEAYAAPIAAPRGATKLGGRLVEVPPGKRSWPLHNHHANDEIFVIVSGSGKLRYGSETWPVAAGDVAVCPAGGRDTAHQLINDGKVPLRYLAISSMHEPEVTEYPDSGKFAVVAGTAPGGEKSARRFHHIGRVADSADYWEGEE
ncbi:cupin domain-containing protein [Zavarzinia sp.]|uniref:cupin domain-containing protein n=1 Tax=Zavarzinia sp. TaxID=2027920 RepID=UPI0035678B5F